MNSRKNEMDSSQKWGIFLAATASMFLRCFAVMVVWNWFVAPMGAPRISYADAWGFAILASAVLVRYDERASEWGHHASRVAFGISHSITILAFAVILKALTK